MGLLDAPGIRPYNRNSLVMLGDSRLAQCYVDAQKRQRTGYNFISQALALCGQRFKIAGNFATSGQRSDQYMSPANVASARATDAHWLLVYGIVNDVSAAGNAVDYWTTYIKPVVQAWTGAGRGVILITETGANNFAASGAAYMGAVHKYNAQIREYCRARQGVVLFDAAALLMLPGSNMTINSAYSSDGVHIGLMAGANMLGQHFAALLSTLAPPQDRLVSSVDQVYANGGVQWQPNPLFTATTTGGTISGTRPTGVGYGSAPGGSSAVGSIVAGDYGNNFELAITAGGAGAYRLSIDLTGVAVESPGDVFYANGLFSVASGATNFQWAGMYLESNRASVTTATRDGYCVAANGALPSGAQSWVSETERLTIQSGARGWLTAYVDFWFAGAGSATVTMSRLGVWRVPA